MSKPEKNSWCGCPIRYGAGILGDKWTFLILRDIMFKNKQYYSEFHGSEEGISTNILADRLTKLEQSRILKKQTDPQNLSKFIYSLTEKGLDLIPVMITLVVWAEKHDKNTLVPRSQLKQIQNKKFESELRKKLRRM